MTYMMTLTVTYTMTYDDTNSDIHSDMMTLTVTYINLKVMLDIPQQNPLKYGFSGIEENIYNR